MARTQRTTRKPRRPRLSVVPSPDDKRADTVRWSKVIAARARIAAGHYDRKDVKDRLIESVLRELDRG